MIQEHLLAKGRAFILVSVFFLSLVGLGVKWLARIPFYELIFARCFVSFILCALTMNYQKIPFIGNRKNNKLLILRGLTGTFGLCCWFSAIKHLNLAYAVMLMQMSPIFILIFSSLIWHHHLSRNQALVGIFAFIGVYWSYRSYVDALDFYVTIGLLGAILNAIAYMLIYALKGREAPMTVLFYFTLVAIPISGAMCLIEWVMPQAEEWLLLLGIGLATHIAQYCITNAYQYCKPNQIAIFSHLAIVFAGIYSYFIFDERLSFDQTIGMLIIVLSVIASSYLMKKSTNEDKN